MQRSNCYNNNVLLFTVMFNNYTHLTIMFLSLVRLPSRLKYLGKCVCVCVCVCVCGVCVCVVCVCEAILMTVKWCAK